MYDILFLLLFPLIIAAILLVFRSEKIRSIIVKVSAAVIAIASIYVAIKYIDGGTVLFDFENVIVDYLMLITEVCLGIVIFYLGIKYKKYLVSILALIQTPLMAWFELTKGHDILISNYLYIDGLSSIMVLIIGIIGSLITVYAVGYMKDFQKHHEGEPDRRYWFFFLMFVFLSAMFGIVTSNSLAWMFFFWEITTLCSFFLIGYTKTDEAVKNSFLQLVLNLVGGLAFVFAIVIIGSEHDILEFNKLLALGTESITVLLPIALLSLAGIVKAAQMPFHSWLLGAMVAPTPTSALLHSSTMVKAGVFLILKLSPSLQDNVAGEMVMIVGGVTFLLASMAAISQSNAKRVLAYSTIANLGLIVACGGVGVEAAVWAGIMLMIFHAITKSLLFLCVGTAEHHIGSRNIEDMDGLFSEMPKLAMFMIIGIAGMFLAPFGMLVSKWQALTAFVDSQSLILIICICFGSAVTAFYWTKWLGKLVAIVAGKENVEKTVHKEEWFVLGTLTALVIVTCLTFPLISEYMVSPYLGSVFSPGGSTIAALGSGNMYILLAMLALVLLLPIPFLGKTKKKIVPNYMCGVNTGDNLSFTGAMNCETQVSLRNWYMESWFGEDRMNKFGLVITIITILAAIILILGGVA